MRVLVVEDDPVTRRSIVGLLRRLCIADVIEAADGEEALDHLKGMTDIDLTLVDWMLPGTSGIDVVRAARANRSHKGMRIMMVTGQNDREDVQVALASGADEYLMKPIERGALISKLNLMGLKGSWE
jgi:two-component system chemotaxis response regulator CheY